jgi:hypothetical protein
LKIFVEWWWLAALGIASAFFYWTPPKTKENWSPRLRRLTPMAFVIVSLSGLFLKGFTGKGVDDYVSSALTDTFCAVLPGIQACGARAKLATSTEAVVSKVEAPLQESAQERLESQQRLENQRLLESDVRLNELRAAVASADPILSGTVDRLASARKAITTFDEGRLSGDERARLIAAGDGAQSRLADSDRRISQLMNAHAAWRANFSAFTVRALADGDRGMNDFDKSRNIRGLSEALRDVSVANGELVASAARWRALEQSIDRAGREPIEFYWRPLQSAVNQITSIDRDLASQAQREILSKAQARLDQAQAPAAKSKLDDFGTIPSTK